MAGIESFQPEVLSPVTTMEPLSGLERLVRSHAIWFLPAVTREEAVSFLHAKEEGVGHRTIVYNKIKLILHATP